MIRGLKTHAGVLYSVEDGFLYSYDSLGLKTLCGALNSTSGIVDFASNLTQLCVNDGSYLYVYTPSLLAFQTSPNYPGGDRISFLNQRINFLYRNTFKFGWTALGDATTIDVLDFDSGESTPTPVVAQIAFQQELWILKQDGVEVWDPTAEVDSGGVALVYQKSSAAIDFGCLAAHSVQKTPASIFWLGRAENGQAVVMQGARGGSVVKVSSRAIEDKFDGVILSGARAFTYMNGGMSFYCLNVPALDTTLTYCETVSEWIENAEWNGAYSKWRPTCHAFAYGKHFFGADQIYVGDNSVNNFAGSVKRRERVAPVISSPDQKLLSFPLFEIVCDKGTGAQVMLQYSDDNGANWSGPRVANVGQTGQFAGRCRFNRLGSSRNRVYRVVMTDDEPFNPVQVNVVMS